MNDNPHSTLSVAGRPIHALLVPFPIVCFIGALATDIAYWRTANMFWTNMSAWLLVAGLAVGALAALAGMIDFLGDRRVRAQRPAWPHAVGNIAVMVLALFNAFIHSRDAWTSVVPTGLILSAATVAVILCTSWLGLSMVFRHRVGVISQ